MVMCGSAYGQEKGETVKQKYEFEKNGVLITLECNRQYIYTDDSCKINFSIKNKTNKDIYILENKSFFNYRTKDNTLMDVIIEFGGYIESEIDTPIKMKIVKPNCLYYDQLTLNSNYFNKYSLMNNINVKCNFGYLDNLDSLNKFYPAYTNIKTERISEDEIVTSSVLLYMCLRKFEVGALSIKCKGSE